MEEPNESKLTSVLRKIIPQAREPIKGISMFKRTLNFIVFFGLLITSVVLFWLQDIIFGSIILLALGEFLLYNKVEAMGK